MNEIEDLTSKAMKLLEDFSGLDVVRRYHELLKAVEEDTRLSSLKKQRESLQSSIRYLKDEKKDEAIKACKEMQIEYDNDPLVINMRQQKEEILKLIEPLTETLL